MPTADIVIIGGGIIGTSIAYQLSSRGLSNVILLERTVLAGGSSGRCMGNLYQQYTDELGIQAAQEGLEFYQQFLAEHPEVNPPPLYQFGSLLLTTMFEYWDPLQSAVAQQQELGVPTKLVTPDEIQQIVPQVLVEDCIGGSFCPTDGYTNPAALTRALAYVARDQGVTLREHTEVTGITVADDKVQAVQTTDETIATPLVINAAGCYAALIARMVGIDDLPVQPLRRQFCQSKQFNDIVEHLPLTIDLDTGFHFRRRHHGVAMGLPLKPSAQEANDNQTLAPEAFTFKVDEHFCALLQANARYRCPALIQANTAHQWSCLYDMTPDQKPILGKTNVDGFLCACGFCGQSLIHAPMAARLIGELLTAGTSGPSSIEQYSLQRFRGGQHQVAILPLL